jgi:hypothetical protein
VLHRAFLTAADIVFTGGNGWRVDLNQPMRAIMSVAACDARPNGRVTTLAYGKSRRSRRSGWRRGDDCFLRTILSDNRFPLFAIML